LSTTSRKTSQSGNHQTSMRRIRQYVTMALLLGSVLVLILLGVFQKDFFLQIAAIVRENIWPAIIAVLTFFGFVAGGVIKNPPKSFARLLENGFLQVGAVELFLFISGLTAYAFFAAMRPEIVLILASGMNEPQLRVLMSRQEDSPEKADTVRVPDSIHNRKAGTYHFRIVERYYRPLELTVPVKAGEKKIVTLRDIWIPGSIIVNSDPSGAEILLNGFAVGQTPDTLTNLKRESYEVELKRRGFHEVTRMVNLSSDSVKNLGKIRLPKLYKIDFICASQQYEFTVRGVTYHGTQWGLKLPEGSYVIKFRRYDEPLDSTRVLINANRTITIP